MIYEYNNFDEDYSNADGRRKRKMLLGELSNLIANEQDAVINAFGQAGIPLDKEATPKQIQKAVFRHIRPSKRKQRRNRKLLRNLSILVFANTRTPDSEFASFFKKKGGTTTPKVPKTSGEKSGWLKNLFKKSPSVTKDGTTTGGTSKIGDFFKANKSTIGDIGKGLLGGLFSSGGQSQVNSQVDGYGNQGGQGGQGGEKAGMSMGAKIGIGVGVLALVGFIIFMARRGNKN